MIAIGTNYRGLSANDMTQLRKELTEKGIDYKVVKNSLAKIAADEVGDTEFHKLLEETTGVAFSSGDPVSTFASLSFACGKIGDCVTRTYRQITSGT